MALIEIDEIIGQFLKFSPEIDLLFLYYFISNI